MSQNCVAKNICKNREFKISQQKNLGVKWMVEAAQKSVDDLPTCNGLT